MPSLPSHKSQIAISDSEHTLVRPTSVSEIEKVMTQMDADYQTSFCEWIRSESNVAYMCSYKRSIFRSQYANDPKVGIKVVQWMTQNWTLVSISEFLFKMFPDLSIDSKEFADLLCGMTQSWDFDRVQGMFFFGDRVSHS